MTLTKQRFRKFDAIQNTSEKQELSFFDIHKQIHIDTRIPGIPFKIEKGICVVNHTIFLSNDILIFDVEILFRHKRANFISLKAIAYNANSLAFSFFKSLVLIARVLMIHASCPHFHPFSKPIQNFIKMLQHRHRRFAAVTALPHPSTQLFRFTIILVFLGRLNGDSVCRPFRPSSFWHFSWVRSYS